MFFGLMNSPATFQAMMNELFKDLIASGTVFVYMDDILIATRTMEEHRRIVHQVLQILESNQLFLKPEKCEFEKDEVNTLVSVSRLANSLWTPSNLGVLQIGPLPQKLKRRRAFLGFTGFYRRFIRNYSHLARPLNDLTRKTSPWQWGEPEQDAFDRLKQRFLAAPILVQPDLTAPFRLECDTSKYACGAFFPSTVPMVFGIPSPSCPNHSLKPNRTTISTIENFSPLSKLFVNGDTTLKAAPINSKSSLIIRTSKSFVMRPSSPIVKLAGLNSSLASLSLSIISLERKLVNPMLYPVALTMFPDHEDNEDCILLSPSLFAKPQRVTFTFEDSSLLQRIKDCQALDTEVVDVLRYLLASKSSPTKKLLSPDWTVQDGLTFYKGRLYVPADLDIRSIYHRSLHDTPSVGHPGHLKTWDLVKRQFYWPGIRDSPLIMLTVALFVRQQESTHHPSVPLHPIPPLSDATPFFHRLHGFHHGNSPSLMALMPFAVFVDHDVTKSCRLCSLSLHHHG